MDPVNTAFSSGIDWVQTTGSKADHTHRSYEIIAGAPGTGKAGGLGDLEALCSPAPIVLGNRVWNDTDADGVQDPGETGLGSIIIQIYSDPDGIPNNGYEVLIGTTTTDGSGNYLITDAVLQNGPDGINGNGDDDPNAAVTLNTNYLITIDPSQSGISTNNFIVTFPDTDEEQRDSDATRLLNNGGSLTDFIAIPLSTSGAGVNEYNMDFGFTAQENNPVSLYSFEAYYVDNSLKFDWVTGTETHNAGFNLWVVINGKKHYLNDDIIPSHLTDSLIPQYYQQLIPAGDIKDEFMLLGLSSIDIKGKEEFHGPFKLGEKYGSAPVDQQIDWRAIRSGIDKQLESKNLVLRDNSLRAVNKGKFTTTLANSSSAGGGNNSSPDSVCNVTVGSRGINRVTFTQLQSAGCDYTGINPTDIAVIYKGAGISRYIESGSANGKKFSTGGYIDFYGELPQDGDSLYLKENTYQIKIDRTLAVNSKLVNSKPSGSDSSYTETTLRHHNLIYSFTMASENDPWYERRIFSRGSPVSADFEVVTESDALTTDPAVLTVSLAGGIDAPGVDPDHHVKIYINGNQVGDFFNNGFVDWLIEIPLAGNIILPGSNIVTVEAVGDTGFPFDIVLLNYIELSYERPYTAVADKLLFEETVQSDFVVTGLSTDSVVSYAYDGIDLYILKAETAANAGVFDVSIPGVQNNSTSAVKYWVSAENKINNTLVSLARSNTDILSGFADYLIIAHPAFIGAELDGYVSQKESEGYAVKVVDLLDIYDDHGSGMATPFSIRNYLKEAAPSIGFDHLLFVGGDSYDYHNNTSSGVISFIPTMYELTNELIFYTPTDSLIADLDGDEIQDLSIGRWPVRSIDDLGAIINKTSTFSSTSTSSALLVAEHTDPSKEPFKNQTDRTANRLPFEPVDIVKVYVDDFLDADPDLTISGAIAQTRDTMISRINNGTSLTIFAGHGAPTMWTFNGLMTPTIAQNLTNAGKPTFIMPLACYTTYHVIPTLNSLSHQLMAAGDKGAVVVTGAISLSTLADNEKLGDGIIDKMFYENKTLGQAVKETKQILGTEFRDVVINWQTLGDPTLKFNQ